MKTPQWMFRSAVIVCISLLIVSLLIVRIVLAQEHTQVIDNATSHKALANKATNPAPSKDPATIKAGVAAFVDVAKVLQSPRCMNCHPAGDRPLRGDHAKPHRMNISRLSATSGLKCATCHRDKNSEDLTDAPPGAPPGAPHWGLPPKETPMVFQGRSLNQLCVQLRHPAATGGRTLAMLLAHVTQDALVLWAWNPGKNRTKPPMTHPEFISKFKIWVDAGGPCPK